MSVVKLVISGTEFEATRVPEVPPMFPQGEAGVYFLTGPQDLDKISTSVLLSAYNALRKTPIKGFHDRAVAQRQGWEALHTLAGPHKAPTPITTTQEGDPMATATKGKKKDKATKKNGAVAVKATTRHRVIELEPSAKSKEDVKPARAGSKTAVMIDLLAEGATLPQLEKALSESGRPVNARAWVTGFGRFGYGVKAVNDKADPIVYKLVYPAGMRQPVPHRTPKSGEAE